VNCKHANTKTSMSVDDQGDVETQTCTDCGFILREVLIIESNVGGETIRRPRAVAYDAQPEGFHFPAEKAPASASNDRIITAQEMALLAVKTREETTGKDTRELLKKMLDACVQNILEGKHTYLITPEDAVPGEVLVAAVKELKAQGYKVGKTPAPGEGVWVEIQWPTNVRKKKGT